MSSVMCRLPSSVRDGDAPLARRCQVMDLGGLLTPTCYQRQHDSFLGPSVQILLIALTAASSNAFASVCQERDAISDKLAVDHGERPSAEGLASNGELIEVFASPDGTWTMVLTAPNGVSCVVAAR